MATSMLTTPREKTNGICVLYSGTDTPRLELGRKFTEYVESVTSLGMSIAKEHCESPRKENNMTVYEYFGNKFNITYMQHDSDQISSLKITYNGKPFFSVRISDSKITDIETCLIDTKFTQSLESLPFDIQREKDMKNLRT